MASSKLKPLEFRFQYQDQQWMIEFYRNTYRFYRLELNSSLQPLCNMLSEVGLTPESWEKQAVDPSTQNSASLPHWAAAKAIRAAKKRKQSIKARQDAFSLFAADLCCSKQWEQVLKIQSMIGVL